MRFLMSALLLVVTALSRAADAPPPPPPLPPTIGPYLQNPAPDGMTVCFLTQVTGSVQVLAEPQAPTTPVPAAGSAVPGTPWILWKARIAGLQPGAACAYRVEQREGGRVVAQAESAFTTLAPAAGEARLILLNDLHNRTATLEALLKHVKPEDFGLSVLLGDCWADPSPAQGADGVFRTLEAYVRLLDAGRKPMLLVRGNHETRGGFAGRLAHLFDIPGLDAGLKQDDQLWPFRLQCGPAYFMALDTGEDDDFNTDETSYKRPKFWQAYRQRQTPWLKDALAAAGASGAPWKVFLSHIPLYNPAGWNSEPSRVYWEPLLRDAGLVAMLAGHDHGWKLVPAGKPITRVTKHKDGTSTSEALVPPCPVLIGGGPALNEATVMLLEATAQRLRVRLQNVNGKLLTETARER